MSVEDAVAEARALGVRHHTIPIQPVFESFLSALEPVFEGRAADATEENIQARCRGVILMALSNKFGHIVLTTGNKSEMAVGYATLYGDMAGGFAVIKDVPKTLVYGLARLRNTRGAVIPQRVLDRPPSAELAEDQVDTNSLPPYDMLDPILAMYVEQDWSPERIVALGYDEEVVHKVVNLVDRNEYKRRQAPTGIRITARAFGRDRRYPITSGYRPLSWK
jgi:NAD+ synthase (glutamine-hydrolysing)